MDINNHLMGEEIYIGDLEKEISKVDGVINVISLDVVNKKDGTYSSTPIAQETYTDTTDSNARIVVDLEATDGILFNDGDTMMEIKYPENDIRIRIKER